MMSQWKKFLGNRINKKNKQSRENFSREHYRQYGMSPPEAATRVHLKEAARRIKEDGFKLPKNIVKRPNEFNDRIRCLFFLYGNGFRKGYCKWYRKETVEDMLSEEPTSESDSSSPFERLVKIIKVDGDEILDDDGRSNEFKYYRRVLELYINREDSVGYLSNIEDLELYLRTQSCGNCYLIAAIMFVCLLSQFKGVNMEPIDVCKYIRNSYCDRELIQLVVNDSGGDSYEKACQILSELTGKTVKDLSAHDISALVEDNCIADVVDMLKRYGPGLVCDFSTFKGFEQSGLPVKERTSLGLMQFAGNLKGKKLNRHTMKGHFQEYETFNEAAGVGVFDSLEGECRPQYFFLSDSDTSTTEETGSSSSFDGEELDCQELEQDSTESHAMVLLHARKDENGVYWFLLLNWWPNMALVEVSEHYFAACEACVAFVDKDVCFENELESVYSKNPARIAHCHNLDRAQENEFYHVIPEYT